MLKCIQPTFLCRISLGSVWMKSVTPEPTSNLPQERVRQQYDDWVLYQIAACIEARGATTPYWHLTSRVPMLPFPFALILWSLLFSQVSFQHVPVSVHLSVWELDLFSAGQSVSWPSKPSGSTGFTTAPNEAHKLIICVYSPHRFTTPQIPASFVDGWTSLQSRSQHKDDSTMLRLFHVVWNCFLGVFSVSSHVLLPLHHTLNTVALFIPLRLTTRPVISIFFLFLMHTAVWL